ncbi:hypothetical protein Z043_119592 [Scleropages formosus]|uniref:Uncharacterized protein n=1 Tax=Scleropages formosus TaxID=113540 RepID=A0A0P7TMF4_SCLFO|nr:hypothetical protein Z043_119592 [Scleropages formosus]
MAFLDGPRLLDWASSPPHLQFNKYVLTGYRPVSSVHDCVRSLFYLHNELGNIYTHGEQRAPSDTTRHDTRSSAHPRLRIPLPARGEMRDVPAARARGRCRVRSDEVQVAARALTHPATPSRDI